MVSFSPVPFNVDRTVFIQIFPFFSQYNGIYFQLIHTITKQTDLEANSPKKYLKHPKKKKTEDKILNTS